MTNFYPWSGGRVDKGKVIYTP